MKRSTLLLMLRLASKSKYTLPRHKGKFIKTTHSNRLRYVGVWNFGDKGKYKKYMHDGFRRPLMCRKGKYVK